MEMKSELKHPEPRHCSGCYAVFCESSCNLHQVTYIESSVVSISERLVWILAMLSDRELLASVRSCLT